jgi:hypothetical protein
MKLTRSRGHLILIEEGVRYAHPEVPYLAEFHPPVVQAGRGPTQLVRAFTSTAQSISTWVVRMALQITAGLFAERICGAPLSAMNWPGRATRTANLRTSRTFRQMLWPRSLPRATRCASMLRTCVREPADASVRTVCLMLQLSARRYCAGCDRLPLRWSIDNAVPVERFCAGHAEIDATCCMPCVRIALIDQGVAVRRKRVVQRRRFSDKMNARKVTIILSKKPALTYRIDDYSIYNPPG